MPEHLTPLYHTTGYALLSTAQQVRYNQLHACYLNEQTIFFESLMARHILQCYRRPGMPGDLYRGLQTFIGEEAAHSQMFRALNRRCLPQKYADQDFFFIRLAPVTAAGLRLWVGCAQFFPFFLWLLLIQEERALFYAREFLLAAGTLEPCFVAVQRRHLADEAGHVKWDEALLDWSWPDTSGPWRRINARLFAWLMGEYFLMPKRSGTRVLAALVAEFPGLRRQWPGLRDALRQLAQNREFHLLAYSRKVTPRVFARFDQWPEFHRLAGVLPGYRPWPVPPG